MDDYEVGEAVQNDNVGENTETENMKDSVVPEDVGVEVQIENPVVDIDEAESETVVQNDKHAEEKPILFLKHPDNSRINVATPELMKRRDLIPCDRDGKKVYDHRIF